MSDQTRFTSLDSEVMDHLRRLVNLECPASLWQHREDITQQILLRLHRASLRKPLDINVGYLRRAVRMGIYDMWRRQEVRERPLLSARTEATPDLETELAHRRALTVADQLLETLPMARRDAVSLYLEGRAITEVAESMGCRRKQADNLVYRGLLSLRRLLADHGHAWESCVPC